MKRNLGNTPVVASLPVLIVITYEEKVFTTEHKINTNQTKIDKSQPSYDYS